VDPLDSVSERASRVTDAVLALGPSTSRRLIALGGPPASGKSTLAEAVQSQLGARGQACGLVPMDGFHLDNATLEARGLFDRKGSPDTFDLAGFDACLRALSTKATVDVPGFDRRRDVVIPVAQRISQHELWVVVEGNYLFLDHPGWRDLTRYWSFGVFVAPPVTTLHLRLVDRWLNNGLSPEAAERRATENDLQNARLVLEHQRKEAVDLTLD